MEAKANYNYIINGDMRIAQRGTSFTGTTLLTYLVDRFCIYPLGSSRVVERTVNAFGKNEYSLKITQTSANSGEINFMQIIEDISIFASRAITISFDSMADKTHTTSFLAHGGGVSHYETFEVTTTPKRQVFTFDVPNNASGTMQIRFYREIIGAPSTFNLYITNVKLEIGDRATPFIPRLIGEEMALCQRYYETTIKRCPPKQPLPGHLAQLPGDMFKVEKRIPPTVNIYSASPPGIINIISRHGVGNVSDPVVAGKDEVSTAGFMSVNMSGVLVANASYSYIWTAVDAEL